MPQVDDPGADPMPPVRWDITRSGRAWTVDEAMGRYELTPEKFEMIDGKLFWDDTQRLVLLALLLENVGVDRAMRLGDPDVWRAAIQGAGMMTAGSPPGAPPPQHNVKGRDTCCPGLSAPAVRYLVQYALGQS